jgi:hypothetical protein
MVDKAIDNNLWTVVKNDGRLAHRNANGINVHWGAVVRFP